MQAFQSSRYSYLTRIDLDKDLKFYIRISKKIITKHTHTQKLKSNIIQYGNLPKLCEFNFFMNLGVRVGLKSGIKFYIIHIG